MANHKQPDFKFDPTGLRKLQEPLTIHLARLEGGREMPITLDPKDGNPPGQGFTYEEATQMPDVALAKGGGGDYRILVMDNAGQKYEWRAWYPPNQFPPKAIGPAAPAPQAPAAPSFSQPWAAPSLDSQWLTAQLAPPIYQPQPPPPQPTFRPPYYPQPYGFGYAPPPAPVAAVPDPSRTLELQLVTERANNALAQERANHKAEMSALEAKLDRLASMLERPAAPTGPSPETLAMQAELRDLRAKNDQQAMLAPVLAELASLKAAAATPKGPDPFLMMLLDSQKAAAESQKEVARIQADAAKETARTQPTLNDFILLMERAKSTNGMDTLMPQITGMYGNVIQMMQRGWETINQMSPQAPHPAVEMVGQALNGIQEKVGQWIEGQNIEKSGEAQFKVAQATAASEAARTEQMRIQAEHEARVMAARGNAPQPVEAVPVDPGEAAAAKPANDATVVDAPSKTETREARDIRLFGPLIAHVQRFREAAKAGKSTDANGKVTIFTAASAASAIFAAYSQVQANNLSAQVPGFQLLESMMISQFVDELLPAGTTPPGFVDDVCGEIHKIAPRYIHTVDAPGGKGKIHVLRVPPQAAAPVEAPAEDDDDEEDEEGDDEEPAEEPLPAAAKAAAKKK